MSYKQKFGYTALGAAIILVGIIVGSLISPPSIAQQSLGEIECTKLTVLDEAGLPAILLEGRSLTIMDQTRNVNAILTIKRKQPALYLVNQKRKSSVSLVVNEYGGNILVTGDTGKGEVLLSSDKAIGGIITVKDSFGRIRGHLP